MGYHAEDYFDDRLQNLQGLDDLVARFSDPAMDDMNNHRSAILYRLVAALGSNDFEVGLNELLISSYGPNYQSYFMLVKDEESITKTIGDLPPNYRLTLKAVDGSKT